MNNNFRLLLILVMLFLVLWLFSFSFAFVNQKIITEKEPQGWCGTPDTPDEPDYGLGQDLFKANCASCHSKNMKVDMTGPALGGVLERWNGDTTKLYSYIRNWAVYTKTTNDPYAIELEKWDASIMPVFPELTDEELDAILTYINTIYM